MLHVCYLHHLLCLSQCTIVGQPLKRCKRHNKPLIIDLPWEDKPDGELQTFSVGATKPFSPAQIGTPIVHLWISSFFSNFTAMYDIYKTASYNISHSFFRSFA